MPLEAVVGMGVGLHTELSHQPRGLGRASCKINTWAGMNGGQEMCVWFLLCVCAHASLSLSLSISLIYFSYFLSIFSSS